ncbi:bifunctional methionine sulfoxide reductase B/A protein [Parashewanella curva]|uniref:Peptide methionine sulfoxide reductase MsrA n=1 Tax=Parashewanella curva TaxID=2338552 RepID=A0A3L8PVK1_9GAMM|nr:bifunctional methionine sulfoxide reductase B/A protein [Parashewanella curva]RLV58809.1 bifunctional methionine sulfoxide reductase B/A protein [Parashewanella curva]
MTPLTDLEKFVIEEKGTEPPFSGELVNNTAQGVYLCKKCQAPLYTSVHKFHSSCGWPSFDDEIQGAVTRVPDADGMRTEIVCSDCGGHLGHVFEGEYLTPKNLRHCVNSVSMIFVPTEEELTSMVKYATFGAGCFWCTEAVFKLIKGVKLVQSGYCGGAASEANYKAVCSGKTSHAEVVHVEYDPLQVNFVTLVQAFFQSHDPTTLNQQGHDIGPQYRSVIFAHDHEQIRIANQVIEELHKAQVYEKPIVTEVTIFDRFYPAEDYHNDYFAQNPEQRYCQLVIQPKVDKFKEVFEAILMK